MEPTTVVKDFQKEVIPDFLPEPVFDRLLQIILGRSFSWYFTSFVSGFNNKKEKDNKLFLLSHLVYEKHRHENLNSEDQCIMGLLVAENMYYYDMTSYYDVIEETMPEGQFLKIPKEVSRIKINFYPNTSELHEHGYHKDSEFSHKGALLALNTCDGYTKFRETGTKYPSVANTLLMFDPSEDHCSTTTTNAIGRFNINVNYT